MFFFKETLSQVVKLNTVRSFHACTKDSAFIAGQSETRTWFQGWIYITLILLRRSHEGDHVSKKGEDMVFIAVFPIVFMKQKGGRCHKIRS